VEEHFSGVQERTRERSWFDDLYRKGRLQFWDAEAAEWGLVPHHFIVFKAEDSPSQTALARYDAR
jgi:hypothetical protein